MIYEAEFLAVCDNGKPAATSSCTTAGRKVAG